MNIEVKKSIGIDVVLDALEDLKLEAEIKEENVITVERKQMIELLEDTIQIIKVIVKKNKQLRDINKNLTDKIERKNNTISELSKQVKELNDKLFEIQKNFDSCKNDTCNCCCKEKQEKQQTEKEYNLQDVLNELEVVNELVAVARLIGIL